MRIVVYGTGAWGTALAVRASARHEVLLWGRDRNRVEALRRERCNGDYLPQVQLPDSLAIDHDLARASEHARDPDAALHIVATPMAGLRGMLRALRSMRAPLVWLCKGFEDSTARLGHEIAAQEVPDVACGVLSGPSFADEVARGQPTALVVASEHSSLRERVTEALHGDGLRIYASSDPIGVEVGGAVKNVMAIASGLCDGLGEAASETTDRPGLNARAALVTRGLAEMTRLGVALGGRAETFMGLSGLGDLVLTTTGGPSRNRRVGLALARGTPLAQALRELGHVAEGVSTAPMVLARAHTLGVDMPITQAVVAVLEGRLAPGACVRELMTREARFEG
jgi:glycerol-3-phosphate dehydrogenase (NAD(P)+)